MKLKAVLLAAAMAVGVPALAPEASAQARDKTTLVMGMFAQDVGKLDPHFAVGTPDRVPVSWMFNALVRFPPGSIDPSKLEPDLAESWESSPDGRTWTFRLRRGVRFHGGYGELTADDVVFSLKRAADPKTSAFSSELRAMEGVEAVDPYTVRLVLKENVPSLLGVLTNYAQGYIVSRKAVEALGEGFARRPIGTGPFAFGSLTPGQSLELVAHETYFRGKPRLARVSYRFIPSDASRDLAFQSGELDVNFGRADQTWVNRTRALPNTVLDIFEPAEEAQLHLNTTVKPFDDVRVRRAFQMAVNRPEIVRWRGADVSREAQSVVPRGYLGFTAENGLPGSDVAGARKLLAEAGYPNGLTVKVIQSQLPEMFTAMQVFQAQLRRAGITLDLQVVDHATFHAQIRQNLSPLVYYSAARFPIADVTLTQFFHSRSAIGKPTAVTNFSHCDAADAEIDAAHASTDPQEQLRLWAEAQRKIIAAACSVPMMETLLTYARRDTVEYGYELRGALPLGPLLTEATHIR